jgi:hypothetical protein
LNGLAAPFGVAEKTSDKGWTILVLAKSRVHPTYCARFQRVFSSCPWSLPS